jgi:hypothetical protein
LTYFGWHVYGYHHDEPDRQEPITKETLVQNIQDKFRRPDWIVSKQDHELIITSARVAIQVDLHAWDLVIEYDDGSSVRGRLRT